RAFGSPDGASAPPPVMYGAPGWEERAKQQVDQGIPLSVAVRGDKVRPLYEVLKAKVPESGKAQEYARAQVAGVDDAIILAGIGAVVMVLLGILAAFGLAVVAAVIKMAVDKGYNVNDSKFKFGEGDGTSRQDDEVTFNLSQPGSQAAFRPEA